MNVIISVPRGTDVSTIEHILPDMCFIETVDIYDTKQEEIYLDCIGEDEDDYEDATTIEVEEVCGAVETICPDANCRIDGNGQWATFEMRKGDNYKRGAEMAQAGFLRFRFVKDEERAKRGFLVQEKGDCK